MEWVKADVVNDFNSFCRFPRKFRSSCKIKFQKTSGLKLVTSDHFYWLIVAVSQKASFYKCSVISAFAVSEAAIILVRIGRHPVRLRFVFTTVDDSGPPVIDTNPVAETVVTGLAPKHEVLVDCPRPSFRLASPVDVGGVQMKFILEACSTSVNVGGGAPS